MAGMSPIAWAEPLQLQPVQTLLAGTNALAPGSYAIPCVTDWNGDGRKDLLVGYQTAGKIALYLNCGTDAQPAFTNFVNLRAWIPSTAKWQDITHLSGACGAPACWVCDFDDDGRRDLLVGSGAEGTIWFYRNTNTDATPILVQVGQLKTGNTSLSPGIRPTPCVYDWDGDGLKDLISGESNGAVYWFRNTNTAQSPIYAPALRIQAGGVDLQLGIRSVPRIVDWDGDGLSDLVCSCDTNVVWCRNASHGGAPVLESPVAVCAPLSGKGLVPILGSYSTRMRVWPVDWNSDGITDLLLGDMSGKVYYYQGYHFATAHLAVQSGGQLVLQWNSAPYLVYDVLGSCSLSYLPCRVATDIPSGGQKTYWTNALDVPQQFLRVQIAE
jgi:hypothetical protein